MDGACGEAAGFVNIVNEFNELGYLVAFLRENELPTDLK